MLSQSYAFKTELGWIAILRSEIGLRRVSLPQNTLEAAYRAIKMNVITDQKCPSILADLVTRLISYFKGFKVIFPDELDLSGATDFKRQVWNVTRSIPYGETRSYMWIAEHISNPRAVRAVGQALSDNPLPIIIPCHRVIKRDGRLGGYEGGLELKRYLLWLEASAYMSDKV
jgi:methylated-DNA-[protein]-cysteine S-methyltransferase